MDPKKVREALLSRRLGAPLVKPKAVPPQGFPEVRIRVPVVSDREAVIHLAARISGTKPKTWEDLPPLSALAVASAIVMVRTENGEQIYEEADAPGLMSVDRSSFEGLLIEECHAMSGLAKAPEGEAPAPRS